MKEPQKRVAIDFDGTLCEMKYPEIGALKPGAKEAITILKSLGYEIIIWSCRTCHWDYDVYGGDPNQPTLERDRVKEMIAFLKLHEIPYDVIDDGSKGKPSATWYVDDKGIQFKDNWDQIAFAIHQYDVGQKIQAQQAKGKQ